jgi:Uma2 family endonuclease
MNVTAFLDVVDRLPDYERWELLGGEPVLMAPQTERHQLIVRNVMRVADRLASKQAGCVALPGLGLLNDQVDDYAPIPDVVIRCGPRIDGGYARDPALVAEVLSPSTMRWDRGGKVEFYQTIPSLAVVLLVYQDEARVEAWLREGDGWRREVRQGRKGNLAIPALDGSLELAEVYADIDLDE